MNGAHNQGGDELHPVEYSNGAVLGYRQWRVSPHAKHGWVLRSLWYQTVWKPEMEASCLQRPIGHPMWAMLAARYKQQVEHEEPAPGWDCTCGLYAQRPEVPVKSWMAHVRPAVFAEGWIAMSGRVIVCERAFKASHAEIQSPLIIEAKCVQNCDEEPVWAIVGTKNTVKAHCDTHKRSSKDETFIDLPIFLRSAQTILRHNYPGLEFLSVHG